MNFALTPVPMASFAIAMAAALGSLVIMATRYASLPERIPQHYDRAGRPDAWGNKRGMWFIALIPLIILLAMLGVVVIMTTKEKSDIEEVRAGTRMVAAMTAYLSVGTFLLTLRMIAVAENHNAGVGRLFAPIFLAGLALVIFLFR